MATSNAMHSYCLLYVSQILVLPSGHSAYSIGKFKKYAVNVSFLCALIVAVSF